MNKRLLILGTLGEFEQLVQKARARGIYTIVCDGYPDKPPSIRCVNRVTKQADDPKAWPKCEGFRPPPTADLCLAICREGFQTHPEWANDPRYAWYAGGNPIWVALSAIQDRLNDKSKYQGRHSQ